jgi:hypothetical protein
VIVCEHRCSTGVANIDIAPDILLVDGSDIIWAYA